MKHTIRKVRINAQGYESDGTYWGIGEALYAITETETGDIVGHFRCGAGRAVALLRLRKIEQDAERFGVSIESAARTFLHHLRS